MPETSPSRTFNDMEDAEVEYEEWLEKLRNGLCLPRNIIYDNNATNDFDYLSVLQDVQKWVQEANKSITDKHYKLPVYQWRDHFKTHFPDVPHQEYEDTKKRFPNDEYEEWRHLVLYALKKSIEKCKPVQRSLSPDQYVAQGRASADAGLKVGTRPPVSQTKRIANVKPLPKDFQETTDFVKMQERFKRCEFLQLYGGRLCGKTYYVRGLIDAYSKATKHDAPCTVVWCCDCDQDEFSFKEEFEKIMKELKDDKEETSPKESENSQKDLSQVLKNLLDLLQQKKINALFAFENVSGEYVQGVRDVIEIVSNREKKPNAQVKVIVTNRGGQDAIYDRVAAEHVQGLQQWLVKTYTDAEAVKYLLPSGNSYEIVCYRYTVDDRKVGPENLFTEADAKALAAYFENNPGCLRAAKVYCLSRWIAFSQYLKSMKEEESRNFVRAAEAETMQKRQDEESAKAFLALLNLTSFDDTFNEATKRMQRVLNVLSFVNHDDIPVHLVGKVCQLIRPDNSELTPDACFELNRNEASDVVYRMEEVLGLERKSHINYPNGVITLPKSQLDALRVDPKTGGEDLLVAFEAMAKMTSKDITEQTANIKLMQLRPHIDELTKHANKYLRANFNAKDKKKDSFIVAMLICRLQELLAQSYVQGRLRMESVSVLDMLLQTAALVWDIVTAYESSKSLFVTCLLRRRAKLEDALDYVEGRNAEKQGARIAEMCSKAGRKVGAETLMEYWKASVSFNRRNLEDFLHNATEVMNGDRGEAEEKLRSIKSLVEKSLPCQTSDIQVLRETENLLEKEQLEDSFFAERLSSIFHTLGRQVLYLQDEMSEIEQRKCEYYTLLGHHIAKATRKKTSVGLLNEYITIANGRLPRMLQNRKNETDAARKDRLEEGYRLSKELLDIPCKYYENACFRLVKDTGYTKLNAYKYMVKANTKMLKDVNAAPSRDAFNECEKMLKLAKENSSLDMAPHCFINAARFYAATRHFDEAFQAFDDGFEFKNRGRGDLSGMIHLRDWRPNSLAWAVHNYSMAVDAYSKEGNNENLEAKKSRALKRCKQVLTLVTITKEWRDRMEDWCEKFENERK